MGYRFLLAGFGANGLEGFVHGRANLESSARNGGIKVGEAARPVGGESAPPRWAGQRKRGS